MGCVSRLGPVDLSFRALAGLLKFTVRRHKFNKDSLSVRPIVGMGQGRPPRDADRVRWLLYSKSLVLRLPGKGNSNSHGARPVY